jgi:hypothetical protein
MQQVWLLLLERCGKQIAKSLAETETRYQTLKYTHNSVFHQQKRDDNLWKCRLDLGRSQSSSTDADNLAFNLITTATATFMCRTCGNRDVMWIEKRETGTTQVLNCV